RPARTASSGVRPKTLTAPASGRARPSSTSIVVDLPAPFGPSRATVSPATMSRSIPVRAVAGIDLDIVAGETVALLGPNGAGKSTTIDVLLGLARPDAGAVRVFGRTPEEAVRAGLVGAMLQSGGLISEVTVRELLVLAASLYPAPMPVDEVLERADLTELADRRTTKLSGGQTQRVRFALALVPDPELLVLDEPTAAMDVETRRRFWASMRQLAAAGR